MNSRERVLGTLRNQAVDRVPLNVFAGWNHGMRRKVAAKYGSVDGFNEKHDIDIITGVLSRFPFDKGENHEHVYDLDRYLEIDFIDPNSDNFLDLPCDDEDLFLTVNEALQYRRKDKCVFVHAWGVFELSQFLWEKKNKPGFEDALINMISEKEKMSKMYFKLAEWSAACVKRAIAAGADVIQMSDDWGQQNSMFFNPKLWWEMIYPATRIIVDTAHRYNVPIVLHSDGDVTQVLDGIVQLGMDGLHPVQESAGMSFQETRAQLGAHVCIMGGLDIVSAVSVMSPAEIRKEVRRVFDILKGTGPFIFCSSHMFQDNDSLEVIEVAYEEARKLARF